MKPLLLLLLAALALPAAPPDAKTQKEINGAIETWKQALLNRDRAALEKLFAPELVYTHSNARVENKTQAIEAAVAGTDVFKQIDIIGEPWIQVYGNTALYKGKITINLTQSGKPNTIPLDVLHVFVKNKSGWQMVARQSVRVP